MWFEKAWWQSTAMVLGADVVVVQNSSGCDGAGGEVSDGIVRTSSGRRTFRKEISRHYMLIWCFSRCELSSV
jgi:hypothetical protein